MDARVLLFAVLRERAGTNELVLSGLAEGLDLSGLKRELERRHPELGSLAHVRGAVGSAYVGDDAPIPSGATVALIPPVSGGSGPPAAERDTEEALGRGVFELSPEPIDPAECQRRVADPACGAVCVFTGTTRDRNRDRRVLRLHYEAYEALAGPEMARIFERCRARHGAGGEERLRMLVVHRTGVVEVGQPSVVIAVASPHREAAFGACRFLIDELKRSLPVWKKESYPGGEHWIGERS